MKCSDNGELLGSVSSAVGGIKKTTLGSKAGSPPSVLRRKGDGSATSESEKLGVGCLTITVSSSTAREDEGGITSGSAAIEVDTS